MEIEKLGEYRKPVKLCEQTITTVDGWGLIQWGTLHDSMKHTSESYHSKMGLSAIALL